MAVVGSPAYFAGRSIPHRPHDLAAHNCIALRYTLQGGIPPWEFERAGRAVNVRVEGQLVANTITIARLGALQGVGLAYLPEEYVAPQMLAGELLRVLDEWCEPFPGYHLYYPSRRQHTPAFAVVLEALGYRV